MDHGDHWAKLEEDDRGVALPSVAPRAVGHHQMPSLFLNGHTPRPPTEAYSGYTLMVAGRRTGKTSFLRLLLDTSVIASTATSEQLTSVAKFVQGCSGPTGHIRTVSIDVDCDSGEHGPSYPLTLTLIDTPSLDFEDEAASDRLTSEIQRHVESRLAESAEDENKARHGDHHVHLCVYFLDPDLIVPPSIPTPPMPVVSRARTDSLSHSEPEPVILDPPVMTNPDLCRPVLPATDINTIRRLSARVNVLPVVARADTLTNERLAAVKLAIRRDLADAGIGFGIFDMAPTPQDIHSQYAQHKDAGSQPVNGNFANVLASRPSRNGHSLTSSPTGSPIAPATLLLPYALISPDIYCHNDGVPRPAPSRHELVLQYTPSHNRTVVKGHSPSCKLETGRFTRCYRWGSLDVLDPNHSDFLYLRGAVFEHMQTLHKYTKEYLLGKFMENYQPQVTYHSLQQISLPPPARPPPSLLQASRPVLAIDTAPNQAAAIRHASLALPPPTADGRRSPLRGPESVMSNGSTKTPSNGTSQYFTIASFVTQLPGDAMRTSQKQRPKKITVACNFCRSRKLKCDGGRPACGQCVKRSNPCDYMPNMRRGGVRKPRKQDDSDSESASCDDEQSLEHESQSPEVPSRPVSRKGSNMTMFLTEPLPGSGQLTASLDRRENVPRLPALVLPKPNLPGPPSASYRTDDPSHIAALPTPVTGIPSSSSAHADLTLPPIRTEPDLPSPSRRRTTVPPRKGHRSLKYGPKVVACNFCRARKTKCDGAHPSCSSCSRRSLQCSYVNDPTNTGPPGPVRKKKIVAPVSEALQSSPRLTQAPPPLTPASAPPRMAYGQMGPPSFGEGDMDLKRNLHDAQQQLPPKKMRLEGNSGVPVAVAAGP
ncbi:hypothetical protein OE88DRAFT_1807342 [Heliocybe sulcata]|uniref:Zn(2)-C6 fungal-type domain-containing protein n=1 Tax=Heliocybe sulcata TaxID=5364 RepID=A0A5C3N7H9_9AGAM|nr:hypothetical protein OE88DRAFT_1807342 [Heliocybe sulcata]